MRYSFLLILWIFFFSVKNTLGQRSDEAISGVAQNSLNNSLLSEKDSSSVEKMMARNSILNSSGDIQVNFSKPRKSSASNTLFYLLLFLFFFLAIIKTLFDKYINNLFKVFLQTSLRQSQLTDQLMSAGLPSLLLNIFFVLTCSLYITLLLQPQGGFIGFDWEIYGLAALAILIIYTIKYLSLQFTGWISGYPKEAESYSFIIFLINKVIAISIFPLLILIAFADDEVAKLAIYSSYFLIVVAFISRFFRSLSLLRHRFRLNRLHFFIYITGVELLPIFLVCKLAFKILGNNL